MKIFVIEGPGPSLLGLRGQRWNGLLLSHEKEGDPGIWNNMKGPEGKMQSEISQMEKEK